VRLNYKIVWVNKLHALCLQGSGYLRNPKSLSRRDPVRALRAIHFGLGVLAKQIRGVNTFSVARVCTVREATKVVGSQSLLFCNLVFLDASEQFLSSLVCGEPIL
jgi:hypothetical protein